MWLLGSKPDTLAARAPHGGRRRPHGGRKLPQTKRLRSKSTMALCSSTSRSTRRASAEAAYFSSLTLPIAAASGCVAARQQSCYSRSSRSPWRHHELFPTRPNRLHTHTHSPRRLSHPRSPMPPLSTLTARATHARPLLPAALASVPYGFVLVRVRVRVRVPLSHQQVSHYALLADTHYCYGAYLQRRRFR